MSFQKAIHFSLETKFKYQVHVVSILEAVIKLENRGMLQLSVDLHFASDPRHHTRFSHASLVDHFDADTSPATLAACTIDTRERTASDHVLNVVIGDAATEAGTGGGTHSDEFILKYSNVFYEGVEMIKMN